MILFATVSVVEALIAAASAYERLGAIVLELKSRLGKDGIDLVSIERAKS